MYGSYMGNYAGTPPGFAFPATLMPGGGHVLPPAGTRPPLPGQLFPMWRMQSLGFPGLSGMHSTPGAFPPFPATVAPMMQRPMVNDLLPNTARVVEGSYAGAVASGVGMQQQGASEEAKAEEDALLLDDSFLDLPPPMDLPPPPIMPPDAGAGPADPRASGAGTMAASLDEQMLRLQRQAAELQREADQLRATAAGPGGRPADVILLDDD